MKRKKLLIFNFMPSAGICIKAVYHPPKFFGPLKQQEEKATLLPQQKKKSQGLLENSGLLKKLQYILRQY